MEFVSILSCIWHVVIIPCKLRPFSEFFVELVVNDEADLLVRFAEAAHHARVIKNLGCPFDRNRLWEGAKEVEGLDHDEVLFTTEGFLVIGIPRLENVSCVWQKEAVVFSLSSFQDLKELGGDLRLSRHTSVWRTAKDKEHILACFNQSFILFIAISTARLNLRELVFIVSLSATVKHADDVAVVFLAHSTESRLQVVERNLFACIGQNDLALIVFHHSVAAVVENCQCLLIGP